MADIPGSIVDAGHGIRFRTGVIDEVPVLDFACMYSSRQDDRQRFARALRDACTNVGFFYLKNHGVPNAVMDRAADAMRKFFALSVEEKMRIHYLTSQNHRGYVATGNIKSDRELKGGDMHEAIELAHDLPVTDPDHLAGNKFYGPNVWPESPPDFRWALGTYFDTQLEFGRMMLRGFALALELPETFFDPIYTKPMSRLRACYYPPQDPDWDLSKLGIGAHRDFEIFTTVWADRPGLQALGTEGDWIDIPPVNGTFVINIGDLMQRWTNDLFLSRPHRVVNLGQSERYSLAQFFGVDYAAELDAFPSLKAEREDGKYPTVSCGAHVEERIARTYYGAG